MKSWTWFDEELDAISSLASSQHSLASSTLTLTKSLTVSQQNMILANGFLISSSSKTDSEDKQSQLIRPNRLRNLLYREEYSDEVMSLTEVSRPSFDLGYQSQSKSEGGLNMYDDVATPSSGAIMDIDLMMSDGSCEQFPPLQRKTRIKRSSDYQGSERLSLCEPDEVIFSSPPDGFDKKSVRDNFAEYDENTFSYDTVETGPGFLKTFGHGSPDLYGRLYFGSEVDLEVGNSFQDDFEVDMGILLLRMVEVPFFISSCIVVVCIISTDTLHKAILTNYFIIL